MNTYQKNLQIIADRERTIDGDTIRVSLDEWSDVVCIIRPTSDRVEVRVRPDFEFHTTLSIDTLERVYEDLDYDSDEFVEFMFL